MINADSGVNSSPNENRLFSAISPYVHAKCTDDHPRVKHCSLSTTASAAPAATRSTPQACANSVLQHRRSRGTLRADCVCRDAKNPASDAFGRSRGANTNYRPICEPVRSIRTRGQSNLCPTIQTHRVADVWLCHLSNRFCRVPYGALFFCPALGAQAADRKSALGVSLSRCRRHLY